MIPAAALAVRAIGWYQVHISPHKGFRCAYGVRWGQGTCFGIIKTAFARHGVLFGAYTVAAQAGRCHAAHIALVEAGKDKNSDEAKNDSADFCAKWAAMEGAWWCCFLPFF